MAARRWTLEQRARQAEVARATQPWSKSTGPKSAEGKAVVARNAYKGGERQYQRALAKEVASLMRAQRAFLGDRVGGQK